MREREKKREFNLLVAKLNLFTDLCELVYKIPGLPILDIGNLTFLFNW